MTFPNRDQQRKHIKRMHTTKIQCQRCLDTAREQLSSDKLKFSEIEEKITFHKKSQLRRHMMEVHGEGWVICEDHCGRKFKSQKYLEAHLARVEEHQIK